MIEIFEIFARGGGGGSGGGGGGAVGILVIPIVIVSWIISRRIRRKKIQKAHAAQKIAANTDSSWNDEVINKRVEQVFYTFQHDWSNFNVQNMQHYMTKNYHWHMSLVMNAMFNMGRKNEMTDVDLISAVLLGVHDSSDNQADRFDVEIKASAVDKLIDSRKNISYSAGKPVFTEIWHFDREGKDWMLDSISQINHDQLITRYEPVDDSRYTYFARKNHFFYNADFGWLLMPLHGLLFSKASFGSSDINHHVIGLYKNILVQFFEYVPYVDNNTTWKDFFRFFYRRRWLPDVKYTVAQVTLPRSYTDIIVQRKRFLSGLTFTPAGFTKMSLESNRFNRKYHVFAANADRLSTLELLNPKFMEKLDRMPYGMGLEVIGTDLYLFSADPKADYQHMLELLTEATKEMKL